MGEFHSQNEKEILMFFFHDVCIALQPFSFNQSHSLNTNKNNYLDPFEQAVAVDVVHAMLLGGLCH